MISTQLCRAALSKSALVGYGAHDGFHMMHAANSK
jgi:hypothetical protein